MQQRCQSSGDRWLPVSPKISVMWFRIDCIRIRSYKIWWKNIIFCKKTPKNLLAKLWVSLNFIPLDPDKHHWYYVPVCDLGAFLAEPELYACPDEPHGPQLQLHEEQQRREHDDDVDGPGHPAEPAGPGVSAESGPGQTFPGQKQHQEYSHFNRTSFDSN